jgi:hypothetical protein
LRGGHFFCSGDEAAAGGSGAEACEGLVHVPFLVFLFNIFCLVLGKGGEWRAYGGGVEESQFISLFKTFWSGDDRESCHVEDLPFFPISLHSLISLDQERKQTRQRTSVERNTNNTRLTRVIDIHQITIQIHMLLPSHLHSSISWFLSLGAWWEAHLCVESVGWEVDF